MGNSCDNCRYAAESIDGEHCRNCARNATDNFRPMTNADRIRNMTDEDLANFLCNISSAGDDQCSACVATDKCRTGHNGMIDWLRSAAEEVSE